MKCKQHFDIDAKYSIGNTALHYAVQDDDTLDHNLAKILIMNGASMDVRNRHGISVMTELRI